MHAGAESASVAAAGTPRLSLGDVTKHYGKVVANDAVSFDVMPGEIVALLGENGAGKTTLMKIAYGITQADRGTIAVDGAVVGIDSPRRARAAGIAMVFQQFALFEAATVLENIALGLPRAPMRNIESRVMELAARYGLPVDPMKRVHDLSMGERQRVEIVRGLLSQPRVLILDEPTSVLTPNAVDRLFLTLQQLAFDGTSIVFISHKLHEIRRLATRCVVMRAGRVVADVDPRVQTESALARLMLGADTPDLASHTAPPGEVMFQVRNLSVGTDDGSALEDVTFDVRSGEIVGIAGVSGNGQTALMASLAGETRVRSDAVRLSGEPIGNLDTAQRRALGLRYIPEQRLGHGAVAELSLEENALLTDASAQSGLLMHRALGLAGAARAVERFGVRASSLAQKAETLSGGNLQKFIVGREVLQAPRILLVHQPTWGVDAGSAAAIRNELIALRAAGCGVVVVSEELDELYQLADRLFVMANGRLSPPRKPHQISSAEMGVWMGGEWPAASDHSAVMRVT